LSRHFRSRRVGCARDLLASAQPAADDKRVDVLYSVAKKA
jgi:hypothetical protein